MSLIKPGHTSLNMEDVSDDLVVVRHHLKKLPPEKRIDSSMDKPVQVKYYGEIMKADDTDLVAGVEAKRTAIAVDPQNRETVKNAITINGHQWNEIMTKQGGNSLKESTNDAILNYRQDIKELRDEVYQLRAEMAKNGMATAYKPYAGFYDVFRAQQPRHEDKPLAVAFKDSDDKNNSTIYLNDEELKQFQVGDHVFVKSLESEQSFLATILDKKASSIVLDTSSSFRLDKDKAAVYKSKGNIINNTFTFGEITPERPGQKEFYSSLDDDTYRITRDIKKSHTGFAYTFRIPERLQKNYLARLDIMVHKVGNPGKLMCYIIDERDIPRWRNAAQAISDNEKDSLIKYNFFAKSQPLDVDPAKDFYMAEFSFYDPTAVNMDTTNENPDSTAYKSNQNSYPLLRETDGDGHVIRYCMIIEASDADEANYYQMKFLQTRREDGSYDDLQLNNTTYLYEEKDTDSSESPFTTDKKIDSADLYYGVMLIEAVHEAFTPYDDGLYSARFQLHEPIRANTARLMLRISREGMFKLPTNTVEKDVQNGTMLLVKGATHDDVDGFVTDGTVVIGTEIRQTGKVSGENIQVTKGLHIAPDDIVYPVGYTVRLNARLKKWNADACQTEYSNEMSFDLPLVTVMPDQYKVSNKISDRLIFEADLRNIKDKLDEFNDFELQISWKKTCAHMATNFAGRIFDLALSFDRAADLAKDA